MLSARSCQEIGACPAARRPAFRSVEPHTPSRPTTHFVDPVLKGPSRPRISFDFFWLLHRIFGLVADLPKADSVGIHEFSRQLRRLVAASGDGGAPVLVTRRHHSVALLVSVEFGLQQRAAWPPAQVGMTRLTK